MYRNRRIIYEIINDKYINITDIKINMKYEVINNKNYNIKEINNNILLTSHFPKEDERL